MFDPCGANQARLGNFRSPLQCVLLVGSGCTRRRGSNRPGVGTRRQSHQPVRDQVLRQRAVSYHQGLRGQVAPKGGRLQGICENARHHPHHLDLHVRNCSGQEQLRHPMQRHLRRPFRPNAPLIRTNSDQAANQFRYYFCAVKSPVRDFTAFFFILLGFCQSLLDDKDKPRFFL